MSESIGGPSVLEITDTGTRVSQKVLLSLVTNVHVPGVDTVNTFWVLKLPGGVTDDPPGARMVYETGPPLGKFVLALMILMIARLLLLQPSVKFSGLVTLKEGNPWFENTVNCLQELQPLTSSTMQCV